MLLAVLGRRLPDPLCRPAAALGYRTVHYPGRAYPALIATPGQSAPGLILCELTPSDLDRLDAFEGDEYRRGPISVTTASGPAAAQAYLPTIIIPAGASPWSLTTWTQMHKAEMLSAAMDSARTSRDRTQPPRR
jgi:hypothetical protein